ncbi:hypothetical protein PMAYCL1PPCAC_21217, partial [Pristionchus mayeri]
CQSSPITNRFIIRFIALIFSPRMLTAILFVLSLHVVEPIVTCTTCQMNNATDCTGDPCQGNYCKYKRMTAPDGIPFVRRSCSFYNFAEFPDGTQTENINRCESSTIDGVDYAIELCNSGSLCDTHCNSDSPRSALFLTLIVPMAYLFMN